MSCRSEQQLKKDILSLQNAITELYSKLHLSPDDILVPSWRHPERTAISIDMQSIMDGTTDNDQYKTLLELLVDRMLLILQLCIGEIDSFNGKSKCSIPLTIPSTVKKFSCGFIMQEAKHLELNKHVTSLREEVNTLRKTLSTTQEQCMLYKEVISANSSNCIDGITSIPIASYAVPPASTTGIDNPDTRNISTQTTETSLSTCLQCPEHFKVLKTIAGKVCDLSNELRGSGNESITLTGTKQCVDAIQNHLLLMKEHTMSIHSNNDTVKKELANKQCLVVKLEEQSSSLIIGISELQSKLNAMQKSHEENIEFNQKSHQTEITKLKTKISTLLVESNLLRKDMTNLKKVEIKLRQALAQKETLLDNLLMENDKLKETLQKEIDNMKNEYINVCQQLKHKCIELNKTSAKLNNLGNQCQSLQIKQAKLLNQVDELDQKCSLLSEQLNESMDEREVMKKKLVEMTDKCKQKLEELQKEKEMLLSSNEEKEHLKKQSLKLQDELVMAQNELKKELQKTKLLMDYPFSSVITRPLSATHTRQHINANTARILLLEEQNDKLREGWGSATGYNDDKDGNASSTWIDEPTQLWEDVPKTDSRFSLSQSRSDSKFKGRLGHLIDAIADSHESILSHYSNEETCSGLETHSCIDCDRLFCSLDDFHEHIKDCKTELSTMHMTTP